MLASLFNKIAAKLPANRAGRLHPDAILQDGRRPNDGPPDLDQIWRDFNQSLSRLFGPKGGRNGNGNGGPNFTPDMKGAGIGAGVVAVVAVLLWASSGFFIVQEGQTAVILTFGKYKGQMAPAGFNWRWPYPIQDAEIVNVSQVRTLEIGYRNGVKNKQLKEALMLTDDENIIDIQFAVQYKLKNAADWIFNNRDQEEMLRQVAETAVREIVGKSKMDFVLYEGREKVAFEVAQLMQHILDRYKSGVLIANVTMQAVQPPEQVQSAFDDAVKAGQDRERQKNEGQAYANDVIPKARGAAFRLEQEAEAYRSRVTESAAGDASRFRQVVAEYQKAPAVTRDRMYLDTMQQIFSNSTKVMIDTKSGNNMLYLPLDKIMSMQETSPSGRVGSGTLMQQGQAEAAPADTPRPHDTRGRDSRDSRDRDGK